MGRMKQLYYDCRTALHEQWQEEWELLNESSQTVIIEDYSSMYLNEQWSDQRLAALEYQNRIFKGNLQKYVDTLTVSKKGV